MARQLCTHTRRVPSRRLTHLCGAFLAAASFVALAAQAPAAETVTGVTDTEILVGTITDLSGVTANSANAIRLTFDDVNVKGGIHGRKSALDQVRAGVKYFVEQRGKKSVCLMYQDTDFGKESLIGVNRQTEATGMKLVAGTAHKPTDTDFSANVAKLR